MVTKVCLSIVSALLFSVSAFAAQDEYARVEIRGTLQSEEGRASVSSGGFRYDLDVAGREMRDFVQKHDRDMVLVRGRLHVEEGRDGCPIMTVVADRISEVAPSVRFEERPVRERYIEERPVIRERVIKEDKPIFKAGPLEVDL